MIQKQANHLISEINNSNIVDDKIIGCAAIILVGLSYKDQKNYLTYGLSLLKKYQMKHLIILVFQNQEI